MNLDDLKNFKFDVDALKNISPDDIRDFINEHQAVVLTGILLIVAVITTVVILNGRFAEYAGLKQQLEVLRSKEQPVKDYEKLTKETADFIKAIPPSFSESNIISFLTETANRRQIQIDAVDQAQVKVNGFYQETVLNFSCGKTSFDNALLFLHELENPKLSIKIDSINMTQVDAADGEGDPDVSLQLSISSVGLIKNEPRKHKKK